jgi:hypothetical protein
MGSLVVMLCIGAAAVAATLTPSYVSASVSPHHLLKAPYTFTTVGTIHYRHCPHGVTKNNYCVDVAQGQACKGSVSLDVRLGSDPLLADAQKKVLTTSGAVSKKCTYSITTTLPTSVFTATSRFRRHQKGAYVYVKFAARFVGNSVLSPRSARQQNVVARLTQP